MAVEMPARVEAAPEAVVVDFPWAAATSAVDKLNTGSSLLGGQLDTRAGMVVMLADWAGRFRDDFEAATQRLTPTAVGLKERLATLASSIVSGAEDANQQQRVNNARAESPQPAAASAGGHDIAI